MRARTNARVGAKLLALGLLAVLVAACSVVVVEAPAELGPAAVDKDADTRAYVMRAIERYESEGLEAAAEYYTSRDSIEGERHLLIFKGDDHTVLASSIYRQLLGTYAFTAPKTAIGKALARASAEGVWITDYILVNPATEQRERARLLAVRHDNLIFGGVHFIVHKDYAQDYVRKAIARYDSEGLDATIAYYDDPASIEGEFYLFLMDENDVYIVHPVLPHLKGTDVKDVTDASGFELGKEIAKATEAGHWVDYIWVNPVTRIEEPKSTWVVRHDGLIFASGYYTPDPDAPPPAWKNADPVEYTVTYVENAIARYDQDGLEALQSFYNSVASFKGQWYLFATDENDHYVLHPLFSDLIGTDIKEVTDSSGFELGKEIAKATEEGHWVEYLWPHPFTLQEVRKVAYVVRHKGLIFASGYYPLEREPRAYTQAYVANAVAYYKREGREATAAHYNSAESIDGQWFLVVIELEGNNGRIIVNGALPQTVGARVSDVGRAGVTEEGMWLPPHPVDNPLAPEVNARQEWAVLHDGLLFMSGYFFSQ